MTTVNNALSHLSNHQRQLIVILLVALFNGILYIWIVPPWQHYDEPTHFEYAWLLANRPGYPNPGDFDLIMRRQTVESMIRYGFYDNIKKRPDLQSNIPPSIGVTQLDDQPFYYLILSLPLRVVKSWDITSQLYVGRITSLVFYLIAILTAWGVTREITNSRNPLRLIVPVSISLLPGFTDIMTSVNNDAGAIAIFSLFLWGSIRLIQRGFNWSDFIWVVLTAFASTLMKTTVIVAVPLSLFVLFLVLSSRLEQRIRWILLGLIVAAGIFIIIEYQDAMFWYRASSQQTPVRISSNEAVIGNYIFRIDTGAGVAPKWMKPLVQSIPEEDIKELSGMVVTLGVWMWSDQPVRVRTPALHDGMNAYSKVVKISNRPTFHAIVVELPKNVERSWVSISPRIGKNSPPAVVYLDGLVLVKDEYSKSEAPTFHDPSGKTGDWDGLPFVNLIRNGSAEVAGLGAQDWFNSWGTAYFPHYARPSYILSYFTDWRGVDWHVYKITSQLFRSLWGIFSWGNVYFLGSKPYRIFLLFFLLGSGGCLYWLWWKRKNLPWDMMLFLGLVLLSIWGGAFIRGISHLPTNRLALPVARYAYPAIIPTMLIIAQGYWTIFKRFSQDSPKVEKIYSLVYLAIFVIINIWAIFSLLQYYS